MMFSHSCFVHGPSVSLGPLELTNLPLVLAALSWPQPNTSSLGPQFTSSALVTQPTLPASAPLHVPAPSLKPATHSHVALMPFLLQVIP
ncbi:hypothetical protein D8674_026324 [Pyrus ussuriensis x Pyrus communis]|uniref:Uncharacterized protein n=1 Tax=Pyrus ussuriensis x Pyrus communis TaxID=2448454 RepID=A0A5N5IDK0_9ROSA|nr:hypothetical protein D8674_026324 [Pyrus ussuriensis x Pyrus communis]